MLLFQSAAWYFISMESGTISRSYEEADHLPEYDLLHEGVQEAESREIQIVNGVKDYLGSFLEPRHMEVFERAIEADSGALNDTDQRLWTKVRQGILRHPAIIGNIAIVLGKGSVVESGEEKWLEKAACKGDTRFVQGTKLLRKHEEELSSICKRCPVKSSCTRDVESVKLEKGFRAGTVYLDKA
jgi:hypothetical protein